MILKFDKLNIFFDSLLAAKFIFIYFQFFTSTKNPAPTEMMEFEWAKELEKLLRFERDASKKFYWQFFSFFVPRTLKVFFFCSMAAFLLVIMKWIYGTIINKKKALSVRPKSPKSCSSSDISGDRVVDLLRTNFWQIFSFVFRFHGDQVGRLQAHDDDYSYSYCD